MLRYLYVTMCPDIGAIRRIRQPIWLVCVAFSVAQRAQGLSDLSGYGMDW